MVYCYKVCNFILVDLSTYVEARSGIVVKALHYKPAGRRFDSRWFHWNFSVIYSFRSHYGPEVDSASNRNEYQLYFLGVKVAGASGWQPYHYPVPLPWNLGTLTSWNPLGHSRPVTGLLYLYIFHPGTGISVVKIVLPWFGSFCKLQMTFLSYWANLFQYVLLGCRCSIQIFRATDCLCCFIHANCCICFRC